MRFNNKNWGLPKDTRFRLVAEENASFYLSKKAPNSITQYSIDGITWDDIPTTAGTAVSVSAGDIIYLRGKLTQNNTSSNYSLFKIQNGAVQILGNIMYWYDYENPESTTLTYNNALRNLFFGCTTISSISELELPATTLSTGCYFGLFYNCSNITTTAPKLPATTLVNDCYNCMFYGCTALTTAPVLPATTLANNCYSSMFYGCTALTTAPVLPATTLANNCYSSMFYNCKSLLSAPELPATTLTSLGYKQMFAGCTALTTAPELPATTLANECYLQLFSGCVNLTTAPELPATTLANSCYTFMFYNCKKLTTAPELPATTLTNSCYSSMFLYCERLNYIKCLATDISASYCLNNWVSGVASTGDFYNLGGANYPSGSSGIPANWTVHASL